MDPCTDTWILPCDPYVREVLLQHISSDPATANSSVSTSPGRPLASQQKDLPAWVAARTIHNRLHVKYLPRISCQRISPLHSSRWSSFSVTTTSNIHLSVQDLDAY